MGRDFQHEHSDIELEDYHPGCMWGIFHILNTHHLHNVKRRMIPHRKHRRGKHALCCKNPGTISLTRDAADEQGFMDPEALPFLVEQKTAKSNPRNKSSREPLVKAFIYKQMSAPSQLSSDNDLDEVSKDWENSIIILSKGDSAVERKPPSLPKTTKELVECKGCDSCGTFSVDCEKCDKEMKNQVNQSFVDAYHLAREKSSYQVEDTENFLNMFHVNKGLFLKILKNQDICAANNFFSHPASGMRMRLTKSGTFPAAGSSHNRFARPSTLKHKQNEVWPLSYGENFLISSRGPQFDGFESLKAFQEKSIPLKSDDMEGTATRQETIPSMDSSGELNNHWWHLSLKNHFKDVKRKIKHVLRERKKERRHSLKNALLHRVPSRGSYINEEREKAEKLGGTVLCQDEIGNQQSDVTGGSSINYLRNGYAPSINRASSLHASLDRYTKLFEYGFSKETNWKHSKSLSWTTEYRHISGDPTLSSPRRRLSLSDLDSLPSFANEASLADPLSRMPTTATLDCDSRGDIDIHDVLESVNVVTEKFEPVGGQSCMIFENEGGFVARRNDDELGEDIVESKTPISAGSELNPKCNPFDEPESFVNAQDSFVTESLSSGTTIHENDIAKPKLGNRFLALEFDKVAEAEFNYVKDVLELSGFIEYEHFGRWNLPEQPLDFSLFKELETYLHPEYSSEEVGSNCDHLLLFDLINEVLLEINDTSYTYFSKPFSFANRKCPVPRGYHILEAVWARVSWYVSLKSKVDQSLEDIVGGDLSKDDGWMNLEPEANCVALDLEDMIFDDLLEELVCF
ncbi:hypothetical protein HS088_TW07G00184 [Tripterygium wilfordii]|uniref:Protein TRM32 n=1 Tax=Tripterygium wilfordii TaxID=458696 RepID=A0A7J7DEA7_TRIWF|nr:protein TRM32-like [Tripterygium wilfordii]XP_038706897.1 protein TRM32-like [Tripterygium wilfordii]KAF5744609.1 hypothetical protein HS088_TW07G00184 [Tripterygium wilfordii]